MSGRDIAVCVFAGLTAASVTLLTAALAEACGARQRTTLAVLFLGAGGLCGIYAACGWAWWLASGVLR